MHLTRLSRIETVPSPSQSRSPHQPPSRLPRLLAHITTFLLLTISTILIFISLLLPNSHNHLSSLMIKPINKIYVPTTLISASTTTSERPLATGMWGQDETDIQPSVNMAGGSQKIPVGDVVWYGIIGPEVWIGPMQICSRSDKDSEVICTSSSTPAFHARALPFNLADSLLALPSRPISPVLLLITGVCILLAIMIHAFSLSNLGSCCYPNLISISRSKTKSTVDSEKSIHIDEPVSKKRGKRPHPAFSLLVVIGFILSIAASAVERRSVSNALEAWDVAAGNDIGLMAEMGGLAHLIPLIPFILSLTLISAYIPSLLFNTKKNPPIVESGAEVRGRAEISGLFAHVTDSGKKLSDGKPVFAEIDPGTPRLSVLPILLPEIVVGTAERVGSDRKSGVNADDENEGESDEKGWVVDQDWEVEKSGGGEELEGEGPRSAASCRTFGVGEAV